MDKRILLIIIFLIVLPLFGGEFPSRTIKVKLALDENSLPGNSPVKRMEEAILTVSRHFEREFGLRFTVAEVSFWRAEQGVESFDELFIDLHRKVDRGGCDIVIGLTACQIPRRDLLGGASYKNGYILIRWAPPRQNLTWLLTHELGHLFGAVHTKNPRSAMNINPTTTNFDEENATLIRLNRQRRFLPHLFPIGGQQLKEALHHYRRLLKKKDYQSLDAELYLILSLMELESYSEIIERCQRVLIKEPRSHSIRNLMAIALRRSGHIDRAIEEYKKIIKENPLIPNVYYNLGIAYSKKGDTDNAIIQYQKAVQLMSSHYQARTNLANLYVERRLLEEAEEQCRQALATEGNYAEAHSVLAAIYLLRQQPEEAYSECLLALELNDQLASVYNILGGYYIFKNQPEEAKKWCLKSLEIDPLYHKAYFNLGNIYFSKGRFPEAVKNYQQAIRLKPDYLKAHLNLGLTYYRMNQLDQVGEEFNYLLTNQPGYEPAYANLFSIYFEEKKFEEAERICRRAIDCGVNKPQFYHYLAMALAELGKGPEAERYNHLALELDPQNVSAHISLGNLYLRYNLLEKAANHYLKALEIDNHLKDAHNNLAVVYFHQEKYQLAWEHLQRAEQLGLKPHPDFIKRLKSKLKSK